MLLACHILTYFLVSARHQVATNLVNNISADAPVPSVACASVTVKINGLVSSTGRDFNPVHDPSIENCR